MNKKTFILAIVIFTVIALSVTQVVVSNRLSTAGIEVGEIEDQIREYKAQNSILSEKIFQASSLSNISSKASKLGFIEGKSQLVLKTSLPLAVKRP
jgi:cell division protein FtsL